MGKNKLTIGVLGFEFVSPNKGCEALVYSFFEILTRHVFNKYEKARVYVLAQDKIGDVPKRFPDIEFIAMPVHLRDIKFKYLRAIRECDYIFDVTMGDSFSDIYSKNYYEYLIKLKRIVLLMNKNYILLPQTYGPFRYKESAKKANTIFKKAKYIFCRDVLSRAILKDEFGIENSVDTTDMAFALPYNKSEYSFNNARKKVGINVSGLLYRGGFESKNQFELKVNYSKFVYDIINYFSGRGDYEIYLIPHVIDVKENAYDDDYKVCQMIQQEFENVKLAPEFKSPIEAKSYISNMDLFIGSRMHSTIAAFSSGVVTIPISYSRKFEGLYGSLGYSFTINAKEEDNVSIVEKVKSYVERISDLVDEQIISLEIVDEKMRVFEEYIDNIISEKNKY